MGDGTQRTLRFTTGPALLAVVSLTLSKSEENEDFQCDRWTRCFYSLAVLQDVATVINNVSRSWIRGIS